MGCKKTNNFFLQGCRSRSLFTFLAPAPAPGKFPKPDPAPTPTPTPSVRGKNCTFFVFFFTLTNIKSKCKFLSFLLNCFKAKITEKTDILSRLENSAPAPAPPKNPGSDRLRQPCLSLNVGEEAEPEPLLKGGSGLLHCWSLHIKNMIFNLIFLCFFSSRQLFVRHLCVNHNDVMKECITDGCPYSAINPATFRVSQHSGKSYCYKFFSNRH